MPRRLLAPRSLGLLAAALALVGFIIALLARNYMSQLEIQKGFQLEQENQTHYVAEMIGHFMTERIQDVTNLRGSREIGSFFANRALGMSMEYGLRASLLAVSDKLGQVAGKAGPDRRAAYREIALVVKDGPVVTSLGGSNRLLEGAATLPWRQQLRPDARDIRVGAVSTGEGNLITLSAPYHFKGEYVAEIVAKMSTSSLTAPGLLRKRHYGSEFMALYDGAGDFSVLVGREHLETIQRELSPELFRSGTGSQYVTLKQVGGVVILISYQPIPATGWQLVFIRRLPPLLTPQSARMALWLGAAIAAVLITVLVLSGRLQAQNLSLRTKMDASREIQDGLRKANTRLEQEIDRREQVEVILRESAVVFENTVEGVVIMDDRFNLLRVNKAFTDITGYTAEEVRGRYARRLDLLFLEEHRFERFRRHLQHYGRWSGEVEGQRRDGEKFPALLSVTQVRDSLGMVDKFVAVFSDISALKSSEAKLEHLAHHDPLTGLPNRLLLHDRIEHAQQMARREDRKVGIMFLDLDRFKTVNDTLGHPAGDQLLKDVAERLSRNLRAKDTLGRLGGDEFLVVLESFDDLSHVESVASKIIGLLSTPFRLQNKEVFIGVSIGISIYPDHGNGAAELIRNADTAMYKAKEEGRNRYYVYNAELTESAVARLSLEGSLRRGLESGEFTLSYQPQFAADGRTLIGAEALIRWQNPELGFVPPDRFIPLAEETGLIDAVTRFVLRRACLEAREWVEAGLGLKKIAVNISGGEIVARDFPGTVQQILRETGLPPQLLELEITEGSLMEGAENALRNIRALQAQGISIAIDDFGTGYSSMSYLKLYAVDKLKIDRSFVKDVPGDQNDCAICESIIALGHALEIQVLAEGVENEDQRRFLAEANCDAMQGYHFSRPLPAPEFGQYVRQHLRSQPPPRLVKAPTADAVGR